VADELNAAVFRRLPGPTDTVVARTRGYTYAAEEWASCIVQGPFSVAPCQSRSIHIERR
jgi:hypothetical protein